MHVVILGCGRVGSAVALTLEKRGHSVAVIDQMPEAFVRLGDHFNGRKVTGIGFDRDTLIEAGIEQAGAFAAVSSGDNSNIIAARVARETFGVETVVARIYDPKRAEVYERLGIPTVATVRWTADQMITKLLPESERVWSDPSGEVVTLRVPFDAGWIGWPVVKVEDEIAGRVVCIDRLGAGFVPERKSVLQDGDLIYVSVAHTRADLVTKMLGAAPEELT